VTSSFDENGGPQSVPSTSSRARGSRTDGGTRNRLIPAQLLDSYHRVVEQLNLPGEDLVRRGIMDLSSGVISAPSLLVSMAAGRLRELGIEVTGTAIDDADIRLYELLAREFGDGAHSKYNALRRQIVSFMRAVPCARR
jgi:hypothetical protein